MSSVEALKEKVWLEGMLKELDFPQKKSVLYSDTHQFSEEGTLICAGILDHFVHDELFQSLFFLPICANARKASLQARWRRQLEHLNTWDH